ncbi:MAG: Jag N-terminal domain-containing protein, partial [Candidatus Binatia bacterium]
MESVETEGQSIDDAIARALQRLGVSRDKVDIEILANATRGLFGFGGRRAKVRATLRRRLSFDATSPPAAATPAPAAATPRGPKRTPDAA